MIEQILQLMAIAPGPQTDEELYDSLRRSGLRAEKYQVVEQLRLFQKDGFVRLEGIRWRLLKVPSNVSVAAEARPQVLPPPAKTVSPSALPGQKIVDVPPLSPPQPIGRWGLFRRMCHYYMDCLLQDEAPQLRAYVDNEDDTWITVRDVPWARLAAGGGFAVPLAHEQAPFQRNRARRGAEECVYLSYPLMLVKPKETSGFVVPLFAQPMQVDWSAGILHLEPDGPISVNGAWLEYRFRQRAEREAFLRAMDFLSDVSEDDDEGARAVSRPKDFARLAQDAAHYLHDSQRFAQPIKPFELSRIADWQKVDPGLYNVAVLTLGPRFRYTRSLLRDLRGIAEKFSDEDLDSTALAQLFPHEPPPQLSNEGLQHGGLRTSKEARVNALAAPRLGVSDTVDSKLALQDRIALPVFASDHLAQTRLLHPSQRAAVVNAMIELASVVTGPPGTGKSEVVASMLLNQLLCGRPTLFASKNHQALEAVVPRLNGAVEGGDLIVQTASTTLLELEFGRKVAFYDA